MLDYDYIKNHYKLLAVDLSRQKELDAHLKASQQTEFVEQLKNADGITTDTTQNVILTILEKIKETRLKFSQRSVTALQIMVNYHEVRIKLKNTLLKKLKSAAKNKRGTILRVKKENFEDEKLPHELFLTTRQTTKTRNAFANNM